MYYLANLDMKDALQENSGYLARSERTKQNLISMLLFSAGASGTGFDVYAFGLGMGGGMKVVLDEWSRGFMGWRTRLDSDTAVGTPTTNRRLARAAALPEKVGT